MRPPKLDRFGGSPVHLVVSARFVTLLGTGMAPICLAAAALAEPGFGAVGLGLAVGALGLGELLFVLLGGVVADRVGARFAMILGDSIAFGAQCAIGVLFAVGDAPIWAVTTLALVLGLGASLSTPASSSMTRAITTPENRVKVNASIRTAGVVARVIGAPVGGLVAVGIGATVGMYIDAVTFLISALLLTCVAKGPRAGGRLRVRTSLRDIREGWAAFLSFGWLLPMSIVAAIVNAGRQVAVVMVPVVLTAQGYSAAVWGVLFGVQMLGNVVALWTVARIRSTRSLPWSLLGVGSVALYYASVAAGLPWELVAVLALAAGGSISNFGMRVEVAIQNTVPEDVLSRVAATSSVFTLAMVPFAAGTVGYLSSTLGEVRSLWWWAIAVAVAVLAGVCSSSVRNAREQTSVIEEKT